LEDFNAQPLSKKASANPKLMTIITKMKQNSHTRIGAAKTPTLKGLDFGTQVERQMNNSSMRKRNSEQTTIV